MYSGVASMRSSLLDLEPSQLRNQRMYFYVLLPIAKLANVQYIILKWRGRAGIGQAQEVPRSRRSAARMLARHPTGMRTTACQSTSIRRSLCSSGSFRSHPVSIHCVVFLPAQHVRLHPISVYIHRSQRSDARAEFKASLIPDTLHRFRLSIKSSKCITPWS
ncbi:hypothetical protein D9615_010372 [Tricholomella constricta]|uniref:Uncharacterized protein n=1 Tax=Tricholomella constricta TaxID=117010 RepID=A0A8H5GNV8_9AGAR|nr:hypothetical protein D9615_010372 [Tricholomella constricta]